MPHNEHSSWGIAVLGIIFLPHKLGPKPEGQGICGEHEEEHKAHPTSHCTFLNARLLGFFQVFAVAVEAKA